MLPHVLPSVHVTMAESRLRPGLNPRLVALSGRELAVRGSTSSVMLPAGGAFHDSAPTMRLHC